MTKSKALCIASAAIRGFEPLGMTTKQGDDLDFGVDEVGLWGSVANTDDIVYSLYVRNKYVCYMLTYRNIIPFEGNELSRGSLKLVIASKVLRNEPFVNSPYLILTKCFEQFKDKYLQSSEDGLLSYKENPSKDGNFAEWLTDFLNSEWCKQNELTNKIGIPMEGKDIGIVCITDNKLADFFSNPFHKEFPKYSRIEVGSHCNPTPELAHIKGAAPTMYDVYVNGDFEEQIDNEEKLNHYKKDSDGLVTYGSVGFTLRDLLSKGKLEQNGNTVSINGTCIDVSLSPKGIVYIFRVKISCKNNTEKEKAKELFESGMWKLTAGNANLKDAVINGEVEIAAKEIFNDTESAKRKEFIISKGQENKDYKYTTTTPIKKSYNNQYDINITVAKTQNNAGNNGKGQATSGVNGTNEESNWDRIKRKYALVGIAASLILGIGLGMLIYKMYLEEPTTYDARQEILNCAKRNTNASTWIGMLEENEDKKAAEVFFDKDNAQQIDVRMIKRKHKYDSWVDFYLASREIDSILKMNDTSHVQPVVETPAIENNTCSVFYYIQHLESKKIDINNLKECCDWNDVQKNEKLKAAFDIELFYCEISNNGRSNKYSEYFQNACDANAIINDAKILCPTIIVHNLNRMIPNSTPKNKEIMPQQKKKALNWAASSACAKVYGKQNVVNCVNKAFDLYENSVKSYSVRLTWEDIK